MMIVCPHPASSTRHYLAARVEGVSHLDPALCGAYPHHSMTEWIVTPGGAVTCQKCLKKVPL